MPTRRALLLGALAPNLEGVEHDLELMQAALQRHDFLPANIDVVSPATRAEIEAGMRRLLASVMPDDAVVVYYSGHGSKWSAPDRDAAKKPPIGEAAYHRFLVPSDFEDSDEGDFRGYTNTELSLDLAALTRVTKNVAAIMDCCHAGRLFRAAGDAKDATERMVWGDGSTGPPTRHVEIEGRWARAAARHYQELLDSRELDLGRRHAEANPYAVCLLASASDGVAYETSPPRRPDPSWRASGVMTRALHDALMKVDPARTTWQDLGRLIRQTPRRGPAQRVAIEGPHRRLLFSLDERERLGELDLDLEHGRVLLAGGRLAGVAVGDRYELRTLGARGQFEVVGDAEVSALSSSRAELRTRVRFEELRAGASARPLGYGQARAAIELRGLDPDSPEHELLRARLCASGYLDVAGSEGATTLPIAGWIHREQRKVQLWSRGVALERPRTFDPDSAPGNARLLAEHLADCGHRIARAHALRALAGAEVEPDERLEPSWELSLHRVEGGQLGQALDPRGDGLRFGDSLSLRLYCRQRVILSAFIVGADASIELLTRGQAGGVEVGPGDGGYILGQRSGGARGQLRGFELRRPSSSIIADSGALPATVVVVLSDGPLDLRSWQQRGVSRFAPRDVLGPESQPRNIAAPTPRLRAARCHVVTCELRIQPQDES